MAAIGRKAGTASCLGLLLLAPPAQRLVGASAAATEQPSELARELSRARKLIEAGSLEEAVSLLRGAVERHPRDADARLLLGTALALVPRRSEALEALAAAVRMRPDFAPGQHALGMALARFVEPERARQAFEKAIELDPRFAQAHVNLALLLAQAGDLDAAARHLESAIQIEGDAPAAAYAHHLHGLLHRQQDRPEEAARAFEKAVELRPDSADGFLHLGLARRRLLDYEGSLTALRQAVRLAPESAGAHYELGGELLRAGRAEPAVAHLRTALRLEPEHAGALYKLARALRSAGRTAEAQEAAAKLIAVRDKSEQGEQHIFEIGRLNNEGIELEAAGKIEAAIDKYASALELSPLNTVFRRNLALALCRLGRWQEGLLELQEVLRLDPDDERASKALYIALEKVKPKY